MSTLCTPTSSRSNSTWCINSQIANALRSIRRGVPIPADPHSPVLSSAQEFYLTSTLRLCYLKIERQITPNQATANLERLEGLIRIFEDTFQKAGVSIANPFESLEALSKPSDKFYEKRSDLVSQAADYVKLGKALAKGRVKYFDMQSALEEIPDNKRPKALNGLVTFAGVLTQRLALHNMGLTIKLACRHGTHLASKNRTAAMLGLLAGLARFQPESGYKVSTFVLPWITQQMRRGYHQELSGLHVTERSRLDLAKAKQLANELGLRSVDPEDPRLVSAFAEARKLRSDAEARRLLDLSLLAQRREITGIPGSAYAVADTTQDPQGSALALLARSEIKPAVERALRGLDVTARLILVKQFGLTGKEPMTLSSIAAELGLKRPVARRIQQQALASLRERQALSELI